MAMPLSPLEEAVRAALSGVVRGPVETREVGDAEGFLAETIVSPRDVPACDNSAMDGYALRADETRGATRDRPARLRIVETIYAGARPQRALQPGEAARIFTGAAVPEGADVVVRQEATRHAPSGEVDAVEIGIEAPAGQHLRRRGEEIRAGATVFHEGTRLDAYVAGMLATLGVPKVRVFARPRVAIVTVGDELVELGGTAESHQVFNSNGVLLRRLCRDAFAEVVSVSRATDDADELARSLAEALERCDVLITSGGASVGDRDRVKATLRRLGATFRVDGVALKPGKPVGVATLAAGAKLAVVLPGNPGAASVAFDRFARPLLLARQGVAEVRRRTRVRLDGDRHKQAGLTYFLSARLGDDRASVRVRPQGAGQLLQNVAMDGWVVLPSGRADFAAGEWVEFEHLHGSAFAPLDASGAGAPHPASATRDSRLAAVSIIGWSGAGKTTLLERLVAALTARGHRVAALKHTPDAHPLHKPGSDTERFERAGARAVALWSAGTLQVTAPASDASALADAARAADADVLLVEGWKDGPLPKIELRTEAAEPLNRPGTIAVVPRDADIEALASLVEEQRWP